jgi:hypothetical protein
MANKVPYVLIASGLGITAIGGFLCWYQHHVEKQAQAQKAAAAAKDPPAQAPAGQTSGGKIPLTVFADEGVPLEAART